MFLSAVFYPTSALPDSFQWTMRLNPIAILVEHARGTLVFGDAPHWRRLGGVTVLSVLVMQLGYVWFMRSKRWFSDVI